MVDDADCRSRWRNDGRNGVEIVDLFVLNMAKVNIETWIVAIACGRRDDATAYLEAPFLQQNR
jgi:hypothetical protein